MEPLFLEIEFCLVNAHVLLVSFFEFGIFSQKDKITIRQHNTSFLTKKKFELANKIKEQITKFDLTKETQELYLIDM